MLHYEEEMGSTSTKGYSVNNNWSDLEANVVVKGSKQKKGMPCKDFFNSASISDKLTHLLSIKGQKEIAEQLQEEQTALDEAANQCKVKKNSELDILKPQIKAAARLQKSGGKRRYAETPEESPGPPCGSPGRP